MSLEARVAIDEKLISALSMHRTDAGFKRLADKQKSKGHNLTRKSISKIFGAGKSCSNYRKVPYDFYIELVGEEPKEIYWREPIHLARKIANLHCLFFDVNKKELAIEVAEEAKKHDLDYASSNVITGLFFDTRKSKINPIITDIILNIFNKAAGKPYFSLNDIEEFGDGYSENKVSWKDARPIIDDLIELSGERFTALVGDGLTRERLESGERSLSFKKYYKLRKKLREIPYYKELIQYRRMELIEHFKEMFQYEGFIGKGRKNYGKELFIKHIFSNYEAIKQEHEFPVRYFEMVVNYPEKFKNRLRIDIIAEIIGKKLKDYKKLLDTNKSRGFDFGVTEDGIKTVLRDAMEEAPYVWV